MKTGTISAGSNCREASIHAVKILKDGTRVDLGCVAYYHKNPIIRLWRNLTRRFK